MAAGGRDLEGPPRERLPADVREIAVDNRRRGRAGLLHVGGQPDGPRIIQRRDRFDQRSHGVERKPRHDRGFGAVRQRKQQAAEAPLPCRRGDRKHAARRLDRAVQRQFAEDQHVVDVAPADDAGGGENAERDREIERRAGLADVGGRQIDRDPVLGELEAGIPYGAPDAIAALANARVRQAHDSESRQAERDVDFDVDGGRFDPEDGGGADAGQHARHRCKRARRGDPGGFQRKTAPWPSAPSERSQKRQQRYRARFAKIFNRAPGFRLLLVR